METQPATLDNAVFQAAVVRWKVVSRTRMHSKREIRARSSRQSGLRPTSVPSEGEDSRWRIRICTLPTDLRQGSFLLRRVPCSRLPNLHQEAAGMDESTSHPRIFVSA